MTTSSRQYQCVAFDAVGTLIHAAPAVPETYQRIGSRYGSQLDLASIRERFQQVFSKRKLEERTSEEAEFQYWREIVGEVIGSVEQADACFQELYDHFAQAKSWTVSPHAAQTIANLHARGIRVAVASNFDQRLHSVLNGHAGLREISLRIISSEIGWRKPSLKFYEAVCSRAKCLPAEILMVGDDLQNDVTAAQNAGLAALLYAPHNRQPSDSFRKNLAQIHSLAQVIEYCLVE